MKKMFRENLPFVVLLTVFFAPFLLAASAAYGKKESFLFIVLYLTGSIALSMFLAAMVVAAYISLSLLGKEIERRKEMPGTAKKISLPGLRERLGRYYDFRGFE